MNSIESQQLSVLKGILATQIELVAAVKDLDDDQDEFRSEMFTAAHDLVTAATEMATAVATVTNLLREIAADLAPEPTPLTGFTAIQEIPMVPLAAGQTATFTTTPIPSDATPDPTKLVWSSSDATAFPLTPDSADATGLSISLAIPSGTAAGVTFTLTVSYTNADGTTASQTDTFTTVAAGPTDVTGFTAIVQSA